MSAARLRWNYRGRAPPNLLFETITSSATTGHMEAKADTFSPSGQMHLYAPNPKYKNTVKHTHARDDKNGESAKKMHSGSSAVGSELQKEGMHDSFVAVAVFYPILLCCIADVCVFCYMSLSRSHCSPVLAWISLFFLQSCNVMLFSKSLMSEGYKKHVGSGARAMSNGTYRKVKDVSSSCFNDSVLLFVPVLLCCFAGCWLHVRPAGQLKLAQPLIIIFYPTNLHSEGGSVSA